MPAMAKIAATICGGEGWRRRQRVTDGRHAARSVVVKPGRDTGRRTLPPLGYSPQKSQASQDRACNGIINTLVLFYCEQTAHLAAMFPPSHAQMSLDSQQVLPTRDGRLRQRWLHCLTLIFVTLLFMFTNQPPPPTTLPSIHQSPPLTLTPTACLCDYHSIKKTHTICLIPLTTSRNSVIRAL